MQALQFTAKSKKLELVRISIPKIEKPDEVLIKVAFSGICGTDLHIIQGEFPCNTQRSFTLGHEFSGTVIDFGTEVTVLKKGEKVSVDPNSGCGYCGNCRVGNPHYCVDGGLRNTVGIYRDGGWAEYALAPLAQVFKLSDKISLQQGALTEPISCISHGWDLISPVTIGKKILVTGAGIIGNLWVCNLHLQGHRNVTVSEPNEARLELLRKIDTGYTLVTPAQLKEKQKNDPLYLFDLIVDCSGYPPAIEHAISLLQKGGKLMCFGVAPPHEEIKVKPFDIYFKELTIYGALINPFSFPKSIGLLEAMGDRYLNYERLGIKTFPLKNYEEAIECLKKGIIAKAIFVF